MRMEATGDGLTRDQVMARIVDWKVRLQRLFDDVEAWAANLPESQNTPKKILKGAVLQRVEELMEQFDVQPDNVPTLAVLYGRNRISFMPVALWVNAANGRVNVTTNDRQYILVDLGGEHGPSEWVIVNPRDRSTRYPFTEELFKGLLFEQALKAA